MKNTKKRGACDRDPAAPPFSGSERVAWWIAVGLASLLLAALQMTTTESFKFASLDRLIHFQANEPFQSRVLIPAIASGIQHLAPLGTRQIFGAIEFVFWIALIYLAYRALQYFGIARGEFMRRILAFTVLVPMATHVLVPELHVGAGISIANGLIDVGKWHAWPLFYYPYDLPGAVFTLALCLLLIRLREQPEPRVIAAFVLVFVLGTFNRETTVFLLPPGVLLLWNRWSPGRSILLGLALFAVFLVVELPLQALFDTLQNPNRRVVGTQYETHLLENFGFLTSPFYAAWFITRFAGGLALVALFWWRFVDRPLQILLMSFALPLFLFGMWVGRLPEHRIFCELVPVVWLSALCAIATRSNNRDARYPRGRA